MEKNVSGFNGHAVHPDEYDCGNSDDCHCSNSTAISVPVTKRPAPDFSQYFHSEQNLLYSL